MRNWNKDKNRERDVHGLDFILPMRNWNWWFVAVLYCSKGGILSYLWGIETRVAKTRFCRRVWFYLTYEELKLAPRVIGIDEAHWFYLTYEELKLSFILLTVSELYGFYLTYEELKHLLDAQEGIYEYWILSYLWGIETL